ncbi:MAG: efflux RND transporter periplasmic adaptor subunit [Pseudomonadota bacterium]
MKHTTRKRLFLAAILTLLGLTACHHDEHADAHDDHHGDHGTHGDHDDHADEVPEGPNGGRLLAEDDFALELAIIEGGIEPEYRAWLTESGRPVDPAAATVTVRLDRLGGIVDEIAFVAQGDFLRGQSVVAEPHSFDVTVDARFRGRAYRWQFESHEGRSVIPDAVAAEAGVVTARTGPARIREFLTVYGRTVPDPQKVSHVSARFEGVITAVDVGVGDTVREGQRLATVEANDSLATYPLTAPMSGIITEQHAIRGEFTGSRELFTIVDPSSLWAELAVFPSDRPRLVLGAPVVLRSAVGDLAARGTVAVIHPLAGSNQAFTALVQLDDGEDQLVAGMYVTGEIEVDEVDVPLAVRRSGLQSFRDFTVVFAKFDETYEVRMLTLGRQDDTWVEVLGGIDPGVEYVTGNSYLIKADVEKAGASHDH